MFSGFVLLCLAGSSLLADGGFEKPDGLGPEWRPYGKGFAVDRTQAHSGRQSVRCSNESAAETRGVFAVIDLNQKEALPITVSGWSLCQGVDGPPSSDYSIYLDLVYVDGTPLWGQIAAFLPSETTWQKKTVTVFPSKPVKSMTLQLLFRNKRGTVWFDDIEARQLEAGCWFDSQAIEPPRLREGAGRQWFVRDVGQGSKLVPVEGLAALGLEASESAGKLTLRNKRSSPRALTVYCCEPFEPEGATWHDDIRASRAVQPKMEYAKLTTMPNQGATGGLSLYPYGCVTNAKEGLLLGVPALGGPSIVRFFYSASARALVAAFDVALVPGTKHDSAMFEVQSKRFASEWGFRQAAIEYYGLNGEAYARRAKAEGIWMPFLDPGKVPGVEDFGVAYHEGDNSVESDAARGILSFRYTEPMTWWMPMPKEVPRTYEAALEMLQRHAAGDDPKLRSLAQAVLNSGSQDAAGKFNVEFQNQPWADGAVWVLNPNPNLQRPGGGTTRSALVYTPEMADRIYERPQSGEYLDSLEGWANYLDFRPEAITRSSFQPTFDTDSRRPAVPLWYGVYELARFMSKDLHARGKLLMANSTPSRIHAFMPLLDVAGTETNWNPGDEWRPDSDEIMNLRRTLSYRKPYLLLQNSDFDKFGPDKLEKYLQRSMFYAVFPSMFSHNAAEKVFWENPRLVEMARPLFKKYIPMIQRLSRAGWEPITLVRAEPSKLYIERYGTSLWAIFNDSRDPISGTLYFDLKAIPSGWPGANLVDVARGHTVGSIDLERRALKVRLKPEECLVVEMRRPQ